jgi:hypothetical protein
VKVKAVRLKLNLRVRDGWYTKADVCEIVGEDHKKVQRWIDRGFLKATWHFDRKPSKSGLSSWHIAEADLKDFLILYSHELMGRNVDIQQIVWILTGVEHLESKKKVNNKRKGVIMMPHKDVKVIAKEVRQTLREEYPGCTWQVRISRFSGGQALTVSLLTAPFEAFASHTTCNGGEVNGYAQLNQYQFLKPTDDYLNNGAYLTPQAWDCMSAAYKIANKDNWNNSRPEEDYFDVNYWLDLNIGQWDKPFRKVVKGVKAK